MTEEDTLTISRILTAFITNLIRELFRECSSAGFHRAKSDPNAGLVHVGARHIRGVRVKHDQGIPRDEARHICTHSHETRAQFVRTSV